MNPLSLLINNLQTNYDRHLSAATGTAVSLFSTGLSPSGIVQGVIVGTILFVVTSGLKKLFPKVFTK